MESQDVALTLIPRCIIILNKEVITRLTVHENSNGIFKMELVVFNAKEKLFPPKIPLVTFPKVHESVKVTCDWYCFRQTLRTVAQSVEHFRALVLCPAPQQSPLDNSPRMFSIESNWSSKYPDDEESFIIDKRANNAKKNIAFLWKQSNSPHSSYAFKYISYCILHSSSVFMLSYFFFQLDFLFKFVVLLHFAHNFHIYLQNLIQKLYLFLKNISHRFCICSVFRSAFPWMARGFNAVHVAWLFF